MTENVIPIDDETSRFYNYLSYNERIMFSAQFGDGKTFFLNHFFDNYKEEIYCVKIYPVNYQVEDNKDIFELIKKDILIQLFASNELQEEEIIDTLAHNQPKLNLTDKQKERWHKKCLILVEFSNVEKIEPAYDFDHQGNMDDWLIIDKIEDVVVGTSIPYNYEKSKFK